MGDLIYSDYIRKCNQQTAQSGPTEVEFNSGSSLLTQLVSANISWTKAVDRMRGAQEHKLWFKVTAPANMNSKVVTRDTSQEERSVLKEIAR